MSSSGAAKKKKKKAKSKTNASLDTTSANEVTASARVDPSRSVEAESLPNNGSDASESSFESELAWCLNQLQLGKVSSRGDKHQRADNEKNIKLLSSSKTPLPRKRQLMRSLFGDYRAKMKLHPTTPLPQSQPGIETVANEKDLGSKYYKSSQSKRKELVTVRASGDGPTVSNTAGLFHFDFEITPDMMD